MAGEPVLGLIAGRGVLPLEVAKEAGRRGRPVAAVAFPGQTDRRIEDLVERVAWLQPGEIGAAVSALRSAGVRDAVMAGKVPKLALLERPEALGLDGDARSLLADLADRRDDSILAAAASYLEAQGIRLLPQAALVPDLLPGEGPLGRTLPTSSQRADLAFGWPIAKAIAELDVGQTAVVKDGAVLALEAIEGTDAAILRGGDLAAGACVVKVAKPGQDPRFDVPAIGPDTADALVAAGAAALGFEAGATLVLEREELARRADAHGIALVGMRR